MIFNDYEASVGPYLEDFPISNVLEALQGRAVVELCTKVRRFAQAKHFELDTMPCIYEISSRNASNMQAARTVRFAQHFLTLCQFDTLVDRNGAAS